MGQWIETLVLLGCLQVMSTVQSLSSPFDFYQQVGREFAEALADSSENMNDDSSPTSGATTQTAADTQTETEETEIQQRTAQPSQWDEWRQKAESQGQEI